MIIVHHLDYSRSTRVLWLLEELGLPYRLVRYHRGPGGPAPGALAAIHPLGKSPVIEDGDLVLAESSAILRYIDARYGGSRFTPREPSARARHDEWLDWVEGSLAPLLFIPLAAGRDLPETMRTRFAAQLGKAWHHLAGVLEDGDFVTGHELTLADMQMVYPVAVAASVGLIGDQPRLASYLGTLNGRPALQRAVVAGGPMS